MEYICFDTKKDFVYHWCGKFVSPDSNWIHLTRNLTDYELMLVVDGTLYIADDRHEYSVNRGEFLLMPPTAFQHGTASGSCSFYWLHFGYDSNTNDHCIEECNMSEGDGSNPFAVLSLPRQAVVRFPDRVIILMKELQDSDRRSRNAVLNRYLCGSILAELAIQSNSAKQQNSELQRRQLIEDIRDYIGWHISDNLKVSEIAEYFDYNGKYLTTMFKKETGYSLKACILNMKMEHACAELTETDIDVSLLAYSLGFNDVHNFSNAFKSCTGLSPSAYRKSYGIHNVFNK